MMTTNLQGVAFPKLERFDDLEHCPGATLRHFKDGEALIRRGEPACRIFVVVSGELLVVDDAVDPPRTIATLGPGEFTGEVSQLTGAASFVTVIAHGDVDAYEVTTEGVRALILRSPELGDQILQAFIARRELLRSSAGFTGLRVIGSSYSRDTFRVRDFLTKNQVPFTYLDLERDPEVRTLLASFGVSEGDTPIVAWGREVLLRNRPPASSATRSASVDRPSERRTTSSSSVPVRPALPRRSTPRRRASTRWCSSARDREVRRAAACASRTTSASPPGSAERSSRSALLCKLPSSGRTCRSPRRSQA